MASWSTSPRATASWSTCIARCRYTGAVAGATNTTNNTVATSAITVRPVSELHSLRAAAHLRLSAFQLAIADGLKAVDLNPTNVKAHVRLARAFMGVDNLPSARNTCKYGIECLQSPAAAPIKELLEELEAPKSIAEAVVEGMGVD